MVPVWKFSPLHYPSPHKRDHEDSAVCLAGEMVAEVLPILVDTLYKGAS